MQKFKGKKPFPYQKGFKNLCEISEREKYSVALSSENKVDIEKSVFFNFPFDKGRIKTIVCWFFEKHGQYKTLKFLEKLKEVGFGSATYAGISLGIDDLKIPNQKITLVSKAETKVAKDLLHYRNAQITGIERIQRLIYTWNQTNDTLKQEVVRLFETTDLLNPIYMMAFSGARGNMSQVRQLVGMRGLMSDPQGQIIDFPIQSNFREGLTLTEYLISTYGARKGIVDTALRTATAGYLTRRLVDVAQHTIVSKFDCGTMRGIFLFDMKDGKKTIYSFQNRLIGRVLAQNVEFFPTAKQENEKNQKTDVEKKQIALRNQEIDSQLAQAISKVTKKAFVRSPLTCETSRFVCQLCYGWSFSHGKLVSVGEAVGIIAAQSIGEPGTQLTMRTFHTGGVFAGGLTDQILAPFDGKIKYFQNIPGTCVRTALSEIAFFTKMPGSFIVEKGSVVDPLIDKQKKLTDFNKGKRRGEILRVPAYALLFCRNNEFVRKKQVLAQFSTVLKKMQYGRAEQTLYSTLSGEFVFGKSFFASTSGSLQAFHDSFVEGAQNENAQFQNQKSWLQPQKRSRNFNKIEEQSLLLEKRRTGDFSEVELKNDILWRSQNWTTVWVLSGNVFCNSFNTNFHFQEGDFFKKTSVIKRVLWQKKKRYKYSLFGNVQISKKVQKKIHYLFAVEKKKLYSSFFYHSPLFQNFLSNKQQVYSTKTSRTSPFVFFTKPQISMTWVLKKFSSKKDFLKTRTLQTNFFISNFQFFDREKFLKAKRIFSSCTSIFSPIEKDISFSNPLFNIEKTNDLVFIQNKSNRFFTDFDRITLSFHPVHEKKKTKISKKEKGKVEKHLFFKFLNKRKNFHYPLFLNISTFLQIFQTSQKFHFFSVPGGEKTISNFSEIQSFYLNPSFQKTTFTFTYSQQKSLSQKHPVEKTNREYQFSSLFYSFKKQKESKKKVFKNSFSSLFSNKYFAKNGNNFQDKKETKNIVLKKFLLRFPITKIYYQKFGYFSSFFTYGTNNKKMKNFFQTFSTFTKKDSFLNKQKNIGKRENLFLNGNENFFGKDAPNYLSSCFFENSCTNTGGIFHLSFFEHNSKKQRIYHFLCQNFVDPFFYTAKKETTKVVGLDKVIRIRQDKAQVEGQSPRVVEDEQKKIISLKPEFFEKRTDTKIKTFQNTLFLYVNNPVYFSNFMNKKDNTKKAKKLFSDRESRPIFIFQIPTFSFLSLSKNNFLKPFFGTFDSSLPRNSWFFKQSLKSSIEKQKNQMDQKEGKFFYKPFLSPFDSSKKEQIFSDRTTNKLSYFSLSSENSNRANGNRNDFKSDGNEIKEKKYGLTGNGKAFKENGNKSGLMVGLKKSIDKKTIGDTSISYWEETVPSLIILPVNASFFLQEKTQNEEGEISQKQTKIQFFDFSKNLKQRNEENQILFIDIQQKKFKTSNLKNLFPSFQTKHWITISPKKVETPQNKQIKPFFIYNFCFNQDESFCSSFSKSKKQKNFLSDFYTKEISWLPQENCILFTSQILKEKDFIPSSRFYSYSDKRTFLFFVNRQGKKQSFCFQSAFSNQLLQSKGQMKMQSVFEGFLKISNVKNFQSQILSSQNKKKKQKTFFPLCQKLSFYEKKSFKKFLKNQKKNFQKTLASKFKKRIGNKKFKNIQKLFSKKSSFQSENFQKNATGFDKYSKTQVFFGRNFKNKCFTCIPFKNQKKKYDTDFQSKLHYKTKSSLKNKKLQMKVEQGWLVLPFSLQNSFFRNHKKIIKKGQFFEKNLTFEQNNTLFEIVLTSPKGEQNLKAPVPKVAQNFFERTNSKVSILKSFTEKSSFSNSVSNNSFIKTEKISFHLDFLQTNKKCRYISLSIAKRTALQFQTKEQSNSEKNVSPFSPVFEENNCFLKIPFDPLLHRPSEESSFYKAKKTKNSNFLKRTEKTTFMQFFRPFQYKILENPQNLKKFFQNSRVQTFSQIFSSSCFQLYKKYHSVLLNHQKKGKKFLEKNPNSDFEIWSNFENMYFIHSSAEKGVKKISPFLSFAPQTQENNFKKEFIQQQKLQKAFQEKNQILKKGIQFQIYFKKAPNKEQNSNFSFYSIQFLPIVIAFSKKSFTAKQIAPHFFPLSSFPNFSINPVKNTIELKLCEKRATFFDKRFSFGNQFQFPPTSTFWLNKDSMNFLFSSNNGSTKPKKISMNFDYASFPYSSKFLSFKSFQNGHLKKNINFIKNSIFQKSFHYYGSTEFLSPYEGELLSLFTHDMYWWKKASEISTLQKFEKLFTIVTKKDLFSVQFPFDRLHKAKNTKEIQPFSSEVPILRKFPLKEKQKYLGQLYDALLNVYKTSQFSTIFEENKEKFIDMNSSLLEKNSENFLSELSLQSDKKTKIDSFITKYENKIYTFQNLTIGYPSLLKKPFLGSFVLYGDNFFGSAIQKPGQIIHLSCSSMTLRRGQPCLVSSNGILHFSNIPYIKKNVPLVTLPYQTVQAGDIVQGIPKVEQFFEARTSLQGRLFVSSLPILLKGIFERYKVLLPQEQATRQSFLKIQQIIVDGVQRVYRSQGVSITDKHLEVVVRQMTTKVQILHGAQTGFFPGELVNLDLVERINKFLMVKIRYEPVILGITRASLEVDSFLSASSFQQTTKILSLAAISRKKDFLKGLKENLLVGNLIPSGTGYFNLSKKI